MIQKPCRYCNSYCFVPSKEKRFDGAAIVATCPKGKALDLMCNVTAEAVWHVDKRNDGKPPRPDF